MTLEEWIDANPLRLWRKERDFSQGQIARSLGRSLMTVHQWELGVTRPSRNSLIKIGNLIDEREIRQVWKDWLDAAPELERAS